MFSQQPNRLGKCFYIPLLLLTSFLHTVKEQPFLIPWGRIFIFILVAGISRHPLRNQKCVCATLLWVSFTVLVWKILLILRIYFVYLASTATLWLYCNMPQRPGVYVNLQKCWQGLIWKWSSNQFFLRLYYTSVWIFHVFFNWI